MRSQLDAALAQTHELRTNLAESQDARSSLEKDFSASKLKFISTQEEMNCLSRKVDSLVAEKTQFLDRMEKKNTEVTDLQTELENLRQTNVTTRKSVIGLESQVQQSRSFHISTKLKEENLEQEILLLKKDNDWLKTELEAKSSDFTTFKTENLGLTDSLQSELESAQITCRTIEKSHDALKEQYSEICRKLDDSLVKVEELQNQQTTNEEGFRVEMASQKRLTELWEKSATDAKGRVSALEKAVEFERSRGSKNFGEIERELENSKLEIAELQKQLSMESQADSSSVDKENNSISVPHAPRTPLNKGTPSLGSLFSPSAHIIAEIQNGGGSLVQLYSDFQDTKTRLEREKFENQSLRDQMNSILEEMENQAPAILAEREENQRLESELTELSVQLETASNAAEDFQTQLKSTEIREQDSGRQCKLLSKHVTDLSRQIQQLLIQAQLSSNPDTSLTPEEFSALQLLLKGQDVPESDTDQLISEKLVIFTNTIELQRQNENLLKVTRELGQKLAKNEHAVQQKIDDAESSAVLETRSAMESLQAEIGALQTKVSALQRERDMFRRILSNKSKSGFSLDETPENEQDAILQAINEQLSEQNEQLSVSLAQSESQFESYKTETAISIRTLDNQIVTLRNERSNLQIQLAKTDSQLKLATERFNNLNNNFLSLRNDNEEFKKRAVLLQESVSKQEIRNQQISENAASTLALVETLRNETANLKAEKSLWKTIEGRLNEDNTNLIEERGRLNNLLANAQSVEAERAASAAEAQQRLNLQLSQFEEESSTLRAKLQSQEEEANAITVTRDSESQIYQERIDSLSTELHVSRETLLHSQEEKNKIEIKFRELELELKSAKEQAALLEQAQLAAYDDDTVTAQIATLTSSLAAANEEVARGQVQSANLEETAKQTEDALQLWAKRYDDYKHEADHQLSIKENELLNVRDQFNAATDLLNSTQDELSAFREETHKRIDALNAEEKRLHGVTKTLEDNESTLKDVIQQLKDDISRQASMSGDAQQNYEREVVNHADTAHTLQDLRSEHSALTTELTELVVAAETATELQVASENSWKSQSELYEQEIERLKQRYVIYLLRFYKLTNMPIFRTLDLSSQNKVLLDQLETASKPADQTESPPTYDESSASAGQLRVILEHVKQEKDIVDAQFDLISQELKRLNQKLEHTTAALDQSQIDLEKERQKDEDKTLLAEEHKKVEAQLNDINILKESNYALRQQSTSLSQKVAGLEDDLDKHRALIEPLEEQLRDAIAEAKVKEEQIQAVQKDCDQWKERAQQILQKYEVCIRR